MPLLTFKPALAVLLYVVHRRLCFLTSTIPETLMWCGGSLFFRFSYLVLVGVEAPYF